MKEVRGANTHPCLELKIGQVLSCYLKLDHEIVEYLLKMASPITVWGLWLAGRQADRQKGRKAGRKAGKQGGRQVGRKADVQEDKQEGSQEGR
jgi:hypothetical protein